MEKTPPVETSLYGGKAIIKFFPDSHVYMVNGTRKTGVTSYISVKDKSRALISWATELARDYLLAVDDGGIGRVTSEHIIQACSLHAVKKQEAATIGDLAHEWIEEYVKGNNPEMPEDERVSIAVMGFLDWKKKHKVKFISSERVVYSKKYDYIGRMDIEAMVDGKLCLVDIKTSNSLYNDYCMQTAAYVKADEEASAWVKKPKKYKGRWLVRISKESEPDYHLRMEKKNKKDYPDYAAFEAKYLDEDGNNMERDFEAFLACKKLYEWDKDTNFYTHSKK